MNKDPLHPFVIKILEDYKAINIESIDVSDMTDIADYMIICSGTSTRHVQSIAENLILQAKQHAFNPIGVEGKEQGEWVLVDLGDIIVHIMLPQTREFYSLEKLWKTAEMAREN